MPLAIERFDGEYRVLSNFSPCWIVSGGESYPSVEHAYQAAKCIDRYDAKRIRTASRASEAKHIGKSVKAWPQWDLMKDGIMLGLLRQKFQMQPFRRILLETGDAILIEGNYWHDNYWGKCSCGGCHNGQNKLGIALMLVRTELLG